MTAKVRDFAIPITFLILATFVIAATDADLKLASHFYVDGKWPIGDLEPWHFLYKLDRIPSFFIGLCGLGSAFLGLRQQKHRNLIRPGFFLILLLALGPGLLVNAVFKEYWGRPRPREIVQFGGTKEFLHPWQKGIAHKGRSFPSGHASAAFYLTAPFFVYRRKKPGVARLWLIGGLLFGVAMSVARITQGAHFLSDNLWAWGMVHLTAVSLYYLLKLDSSPTPEQY
jgi:membrane-associated PAP2 superfamily phosphatase